MLIKLKSLSVKGPKFLFKNNLLSNFMNAKTVLQVQVETQEEISLFYLKKTGSFFTIVLTKTAIIITKTKRQILLDSRLFLFLNGLKRHWKALKQRKLKLIIFYKEIKANKD
jgi:hypothetical protein